MSGWLDTLDEAERDAVVEAQVPDVTAPMLATLTDTPFSSPDWIFERKLDGVRLIAARDGGRPWLRTRNDKSRDATYPELVDALEAQGPGRFVADGEVVAFDGAITSFQRLQQRMGPERGDAQVPVFLYLFDLLHLDGHDLTALPLRRRKQVLKQAFRWDDPLRYTPHRNTEGEAFHAEACRKGWEGVIAKQADSAYVHTRSKRWLKVKCVHRQELVVGGFTDPAGSRAGFGALLLGHYEDGALRYAGRVGTGFDEAQLTDLRDRLDARIRQTSPFADAPDDDVHWVTPDLVAEVGFTEWTRDGRLRHPRFLGLRHDKDAEDVHRERPDG